MNKYLKYLIYSGYNSTGFLVVTYLMVFLIGFFDFITNPEFSFSLFYLLPITLNSWYYNRNSGLLISLTSALVWLIVDLSSAPPYHNFIAPYWNSAIRLGFFVVVVLLLSEVKYLYKNLEGRVEERTAELKEEIEKKNAAESELRNSRNLYQDLVENINEVYYTTDLTGKFLYTSPNFHRESGFTPEDLLKKNFFDLIVSDDQERIYAMYNPLLENSVELSCEFRIARKDNIVQWYEQNSRILRDKEGRAYEIRNLLRNISERKAAELSLIKSEIKFQRLFDDNPSEAEDVLQMLSKSPLHKIMKSLAERIDEVTDNISTKVRQAIGFSSLASHELRTPLAIIRSQLEEILREDTSTQELKETTASIYDEVLRLQRIIGDLLKISSMEAGNLKLQKQIIQLDNFIRYFYEEARLLAGEKNIKVVLCRLTRVKAEIDSAFFLQMLFNIFDNAVKFTPDGGTISIGCDLAGDEAVVFFQDSGQGIPPEILNKIFKPFYHKNPDNVKGTGLGLLLIKMIAELHNGSIKIVSEENKGTRVSIHIPSVN